MNNRCDASNDLTDFRLLSHMTLGILAWQPPTETEARSNRAPSVLLREYGTFRRLFDAPRDRHGLSSTAIVCAKDFVFPRRLDWGDRSVPFAVTGETQPRVGDAKPSFDSPTLTSTL